MTAVELAKDGLDIGLVTNRLDDMRSFYEGVVGLPYEELLPVGGGIHQHRLGLRGSVLKVNSSRESLGEAATGFRGLLLHGDRAETLHDPDGLEVRLDPDVERIGVRWASSDPPRLTALLTDGFGAVDGRIGTTRLLVEPGGAAGDEPMWRRGFRYVTVQVRDVRSAHAHLLGVGWTEGRPPVRLGDVAFISFVRDPDGNWVEVSQRASLTGDLPDPEEDT